jgi:hypothetical protein
MRYLGHNFKQVPRVEGKIPTIGMMTFIPYVCKTCGLRVAQVGPERLRCDPCQGKKTKKK